MQLSKPILVILCMFIAPCRQRCTADVRGDEELIGQILSVFGDREKEFGKVHAIWTEESSGKTGEITKKTVEYWSRGNEFFRVDITKSPEDVGEGSRISRTIVRPEGYVQLHADGEELGAVFKYGSVDDGLLYLTKSLWFCQANRHSYSQVHRVIMDCKEGELDIDLFIERLPDGTVKLTSSNVSEKQNAVTVTVLAEGDFRVLSGTDRIEQPGRNAITIETEKVYGSQGVEPVSSSRKTSFGDGGKPDVIRFELQELDVAPVPMAVFDIGELASLFDPPVNEFWRRSFFMGSAGVVLVCVYFVYRKRRA